MKQTREVQKKGDEIYNPPSIQLLFEGTGEENAFNNYL